MDYSFKVLHAEHIGVGVVLSEALNRLGVTSRVVSAAPHPFGFKEDYLLPKRRFGSTHLAYYTRFLDWRRYRKEFNLLHSHNDVRYPNYVLKLWKNRMIQHYHNMNIDAKIPLYADLPSLVSIPSMLDRVPDAEYIPLPVDTELFKPIPKTQSNKVRVGYSDQHTDPKKRQFLAVHEINETISRLEQVAVAVPLQRIIPHQQIMNYYGELDLWVDHVGVDFYGYGVVEAAACGVPIITNIGDRDMEFAKDCPFVRINSREEIPQAIEKLVKDRSLRESLAIRSREYIVKTHDSLKVAQKCIDVYEKEFGP
jgi:glycosyltransferase involved in cell wall biosynthesis